MADKTLSSATENNFKSFDYNDSRILNALKAYQLSKDSDEFYNVQVSALDIAIKQWHEKHDLKSFKEYFFVNRFISLDDFRLFYGEDNKDRECNYCGIKESEIEQLIKRNLITTKRLSTRGIKMEIDRLEANKGYIKDNIVTACYWCNNAKTDEFTADEFEPIGLLIGHALKKRLMK